MKSKLRLAEEKEKCEELETEIELCQAKQKVLDVDVLTYSQKTDEMLMQKDKEIVNFKLEMQKLRSTYEKEIKKLQKVLQAQKNGSAHGANAILTTNGSNGGDYGTMS